jgi:hypothetical protein
MRAKEFVTEGRTGTITRDVGLALPERSVDTCT